MKQLKRAHPAPVGGIWAGQEKDKNAQGNENNGGEDKKRNKDQPLVGLIDHMEDFSLHLDMSV